MRIHDRNITNIPLKSINGSKSARTPPGGLRKWLFRLGLGCGGLLLVGIGLVALLFLALSRVPKSYPASLRPIEPPSHEDYARFQLDGFESPYLGHTGSWDGKGGAMFGGSKTSDMDKELAMGLRWTFMPVHWRALEPRGPVNLAREIPAEWQELDRFVIEAERHKLNILFQAPVIGGNAGGPPEWAGRREPGKSAPANMQAAAEFAAKLAQRYRPSGTLAVQQGWGNRFGVRAWEIDNEPEMYRTHWAGQAGDYAEMATKVVAEIKKADPLAMIVLPGVASGKNKLPWLEGALDADSLGGSPPFRSNAAPYSIGPVADALSFHVYEGLDSTFSSAPRTIEVVLDEVRGIFENWENRSPKFKYPRKREYWHTEGNYDFIGALSQQRRAAWRMQFFTRAFAAGVRKVCVMDASAAEVIAVRAYVDALPWPFPMERADEAVKSANPQADVVAYRHRDGAKPEDGQVWILWMAPGAAGASVKIPVFHKSVTLIKADGSKSERAIENGTTSAEIVADQKICSPVMIVDR